MPPTILSQRSRPPQPLLCLAWLQSTWLRTQDPVRLPWRLSHHHAEGCDCQVYPMVYQPAQGNAGRASTLHTSEETSIHEAPEDEMRQHTKDPAHSTHLVRPEFLCEAQLYKSQAIRVRRHTYVSKTSVSSIFLNPVTPGVYGQDPSEATISEGASELQSPHLPAPPQSSAALTPTIPSHLLLEKVPVVGFLFSSSSATCDWLPLSFPFASVKCSKCRGEELRSSSRTTC